jgi:hypothetical protein
MFKVASPVEYQVASEVVSVSPRSVRQTVSPLRSRAFESAQIVAFPVASQGASKSPDDAWQSVGDAASLVLRKLRPNPISSVPVSSLRVASGVLK